MSIELEKLNLTKRDGVSLNKGKSLIIGFEIPHSSYESQGLKIRRGSFYDSDLIFESKNKEYIYKIAIDRAIKAIKSQNKGDEIYFFKGEIVFYTQESSGIIKKQTPCAFMWGAYSNIEFFSKSANIKSYAGRSFNKARKRVAILKGIAKGYDISVICLNDKGEVGVTNTKTLSVHKHSLEIKSGHNITNSDRFIGFGKGSGNDLELLISSDNKVLFLRDMKTSKIIGTANTELKKGAGILEVMDRDDGISFKIDMRDKPLKIINAIWNIVTLWYIPRFKQVKMQVNYSDKNFDAVTFAHCEVIKEPDDIALDLDKAYYIGTHATQNLEKGDFITLSLQKDSDGNICTSTKCFVNDEATMPIIGDNNLAIFGKDSAVVDIVNDDDLAILQEDLQEKIA